MMNKKLRKALCVMAASLCLVGTSATAFAGNIAFDVTVGGTGTQDPLSKRSTKASDGDNNAYFRATSVSNTSNSIKAKSYKKSDTSVKTSTYATMSNSNIGTTLKRSYNKKAAGGVDYYMKAEAVKNRIRVKGYYCP